MLLETTFTRTRKGGAAMADESVPMSAGFRRMLGLINGKRDGRALLAELPQLDEEDLALWTGELIRQGFIAPKADVPPEEIAFSMTMEMPPQHSDFDAISPDALIESLTADVSRGLDPTLNPATEKKLARTARLAVIESVTSFKAVEGSGFFIYPEAAFGMPSTASVCIATHEPAHAKLLGLLVKRFGALPAVAHSRDALLATLRAPARPHVLFLDGEMPGIDGFRALETIRSKQELRGIRVVLVTAQGARADLAKALMLGATGYIVKPLKREVMESALPQIFGRG